MAEQGSTLGDANFRGQAHFSLRRTPGATFKQERSSQQGSLETDFSPLSPYSRNVQPRGIGGDDRTISQSSPRYSFNALGSSSLPRNLDPSRLNSSLSMRRSSSPTREGGGSRLPPILEHANPNHSTRRFLAKEEMSSPDIPAVSALSFGVTGKPIEGEGGTGFRCEFVQELDAYMDLIRSPLVQNSLCDRSPHFETLPVRVLPS